MASQRLLKWIYHVWPNHGINMPNLVWTTRIVKQWFDHANILKLLEHGWGVKPHGYNLNHNMTS